MATLKERFLAVIDRLVGPTDSGKDGDGYRENYYSLLGRKMAIVKEDGSVRALGNSWWIVHTYDNAGNLLSRKRMAKTLQPGERVVYGMRKAYEAYDKQPRNTITL
jgi:hypothetical protein